MATSLFEIRYFGELNIDQLRRMNRVSDLFCLVGKPIPNGPVEGFGLVFLEAGSQGLPSLAGDIGGVSEAVLNGVTGLLVPVNDPKSVATAVERIVARPEILAELKTGAKRRARELSWRGCAAATYGLATGTTACCSVT